MRSNRRRGAVVIGAIKKNDGFTLLEIVISIAALSLISVFILQMFMASSELNDRAKNADTAITMAISEIERLKTYDSLTEYLEAADVGPAYGADGKISLSYYYDKSWNLLDIYDGVPPDASFCLKIEITSESPLLCSAVVNVDELSAGENIRSLAVLTTKKYFPENTVAVVQL